MDDVYANLMKESTKDMESVAPCGMDDYLSGQQVRVKVASLGDLRAFLRIGTDTLVHKAEKDLWRIGEDGKGQIVIERLFDPNSKEPIKV